MAFYRKNIGGAHRAVRMALGAGVAVLALSYLSGVTAWGAAVSGLVFALTGIVGYCPACAVAGIGKGRRS